MGIEDIVGLLNAEWAVIKATPISFLSAVLALGGFIWFAMKWAYSTRITILQEQRDSYKTRAESLPAPDTAAERIKQQRLAQKEERAGAELMARPLRRTLTADQRRILVQALLGKATDGFMIFRDNSSRDSIRYAEEFDAVFADAGWNVGTGGGTGMSNWPPTGIGIFVPNPSEIEHATSIVMKALNAAGIAFDLMRGQFSTFGQGLYITDPE